MAIEVANKSKHNDLLGKVKKMNALSNYYLTKEQMDRYDLVVREFQGVLKKTAKELEISKVDLKEQQDREIEEVFDLNNNKEKESEIICSTCFMWLLFLILFIVVLFS